jgi:signal transduction histidine kinase
VAAENPIEVRHKIETVMAALNQTIQDIRGYIFDLRTAEQTRELEAVLEELVQGLRLDTLLEADLEVVGERCCALDSQQMAHITQVAREALSNVVQHAQAQHVTVNLSYHGDETRLTVADDGKGAYPAALVSDGRGGHGIPNMQARARLLRGDLLLETRPGHGFKLVLAVPCGKSSGPAQA